MPDSPDQYDDSKLEAPNEAAHEDAHGATRETVKVDLANHETRQVDTGARRTVPIDRANHETVKLPGQRRPPARKGRAPLLVAAGFATFWAALVSYLPMVAIVGLARTFEGAGGLGGAAAGGLAAWLLGHGVPLGTAIGPVSLAPLLVTLLAAWRLNRAGLHVTRAIGARRSGSVRAAFLVAVTVGLWYTLLGALAAMALSGPGLEVSPMRAAGQLFLIGTAAALIGSLRGTDAVVVLARWLPAPVRHGMRTGVVAALLLLAAGAAFTGLSVAIGGGEAADMIAVYRTGVAGQTGITLVSLAYGANGVIWTAAYLLGPGFTLGTGVEVSLTEVTVGTLPTLPLLAGLPAGPMGGVGVLLLAIPALAGLCAGAMQTNRLRRDPENPEPGWGLLLGSAVLAGPAGGLLLGLLAWFSDGSLGGGRLSAIGPDPVAVGAVAAGVIALSASLGAAAARTFRKK
ncbi:DUF6350 family protein [Actinoplanes sp. NBRC 103695]|uniref:cell division protein PerM n=1 Tax=Actinoplanes sp. NBRC 103695 TaxID=3032202 RepID=UPI0024A51A3D|nr:DUF6350 family protein [Actinoplanes sp. NBRC 103695]GLY96416.1 hypothetical protein Acsp02_36710 [Actinoplanes sp. NBRC 103695]